ncbi:MAG: glycine cleavage system aminomethyltransferase GcvT [Nitrospinae bacterium]|nr:glycine cleavage system aminomethyltransferase GcvT [Nitrospinota bacterium]
MTAKKTPLLDLHKAAGAKMVEFAGWQMPIQYASIIEETHHVRDKCGLFDVSHMGEIDIQGPRAVEFLSWVTTNDPTMLDEGEIQYSAMLNERGGIIDDLLVYRIGDHRFLLCVNAGNQQKDADWLTGQAALFGGVEVEDRSREYGMISVQGPLSAQALRPFVRTDFSRMDYYTFRHVMFEETNVLLSRTGYTGEDGFELFVPWRDTASVWDRIVKKGKGAQVKPIGLGARDLLRLEMRYPLHGNDITAERTPLECGLGWIVKMDKPGGFIGKEALVAQKAAGIPTRAVGLKLLERGVPRSHYPVTTPDGTVIGEVTSGAHSPTLDCGIAMALVAPMHAEPGTILAVDIRGKLLPAEVVKGSFVPSRVKKKTEPAPAAAPETESATETSEPEALA